MKRMIYRNKLLCMALISCGIGYVSAENSTYTNAGKTKTQSFSFIYGKGIQSVAFDNKYSEDGAGYPIDSNNIVVENYPGSTKVTVSTGKNGSNGTASDFNGALKNLASHMLQLIPSDQAIAHKNAIASNHNLWLDGELRINGHLVSTNFILGHNGSSDSNWWVGSSDGKRFDSATNSGINVKSTDSEDTYCVNGSPNNYQAVVTTGECNSYSPVTGAIVQRWLIFLYAEGISSVKFEPTLSSDEKYYPNSEDGTGTALESAAFSYSVQSATYQTPVMITAGVAGSCGTANDYNAKFGTDIDGQMVHMFQIISRKSAGSHTPSVASNMNFWISGKLTIESTVVSNNFVIGHNATSDQNWWIGSVDGRRFDSPINSGMNVQSADGSTQFCLNQYKKNYELVVTPGACTAVQAVPLYVEKHWWQPIWRSTLIVGGGLVAVGGGIYAGFKYFGKVAEETPFEQALKPLTEITDL